MVLSQLTITEEDKRMNASTEAMTQAPVNEVSVAAIVAEAPPEQRMDDLTQQLADIQRNELKMH